MKYQQREFTVPSAAVVPTRHAGAVQPCGECGKAVVPGAPHTDLRDEGRTRKRVCFGKVVTR